MDTAGKSTTVLLVDDDRQEYLLIGYLLSEAHQENYRLIWCQNLDNALQQIERGICDVVLFDYHCGGDHTGSDFLTAAKAKNSRIPIIVMTDDAEAGVDERAIHEGASDYLIKSRINSQLLERSIRYAKERKQIEDRLDHMAHYDHLTDLPNRTLFVDRLRQSINLSQRENYQFALLYIDMNDFKGINDSYGHDVGDALLKQFSDRLRRAVRRSDTVARIGGDEFTVLLHNIGSAPKIMMLAQKIITETNQVYMIKGHEFLVGCSIGIAVFPEAGDDEETLQRNADLAMYQAKQDSVSSYRFYSEHLNSEIKVQWDLHQDFYQSMLAKEFGVFYVPRVQTRNHKITSIEIAPYWKHPNKGVLHYHQFSSISSDKEMGKKLTEWIIKVGLQQFSHLPNNKELTLVFNLDAQHIVQKQFYGFIDSQLNKFRIKGHQIEINLNQLAVKNNRDIVESCMEHLHDLNINFGINNFGTEVNSLLHLQSLPIKTLKLDKRFSKTIHRNTDDRKLLRAIINFAHNLEKQVIAEGVQTKAQLAELRKLGCDQCKGQAALGILSFKQLQYVLEGRKQQDKKLPENQNISA